MEVLMHKGTDFCGGRGGQVPGIRCVQEGGLERSSRRVKEAGVRSKHLVFNCALPAEHACLRKGHADTVSGGDTGLLPTVQEK